MILASKTDVVVEALMVTLAVLVAIAHGQHARRERKRQQRRQRGLCARCGYSLTCNVSGVCPECGTPVG